MPRKYTMLEVRMTDEGKELLASIAAEQELTIGDVVAQLLAKTLHKPKTFFLPARRAPGRKPGKRTTTPQTAHDAAPARADDTNDSQTT